MDSLPVNELFEFSETSTRGHTKKLKKPRCIKSFRSNSFCARVIDPWNNLPQTVIESKTVLSFKTRYDLLYRQVQFDTSGIY